MCCGVVWCGVLWRVVVRAVCVPCDVPCRFAGGPVKSAPAQRDKGMMKDNIGVETGAVRPRGNEHWPVSCYSQAHFPSFSPVERFLAGTSTVGRTCGEARYVGMDLGGTFVSLPAGHCFKRLRLIIVARFDLLRLIRDGLPFPR